MNNSLFCLFRDFLRENGCQQQFDRNFYNQSGACVLDERMAAYMLIDETFLNRCFDWSVTPEGREYWKVLDDKWWRCLTASEEIFLNAWLPPVQAEV